MAPAVGRILSVACLCWQHAAVFGADDFEVFPLSGGIDNGVTVTIKASKVNVGAKLEFLTPSRAVAFSWTVESNRIVRNTGAEDREESWGGLPEGFGTNGKGETTMEFTKRVADWAITVDNKRYAWFDYTHEPTTGLMTHVKVYSGFVDAEVTLERKECSQTCSIDECPVELCRDGDCFRTERDASDNPIACSTETETEAGKNQHCCDGLPTYVGRDAAKGTFASLLGSGDDIERACNAFNGVAECKNAKDYAGKKVQLNAASVSSSFQVIIPSAMSGPMTGDDQWPADAIFTIPTFALVPTKGPQKLEVFFADGDATQNLFFPQRGVRADWRSKIVYESSLPEFPKGYYIHLVRMARSFSPNNGGVMSNWVEFNKYASENIGNIRYVKEQAAVLYDELVPVSEDMCDSDSAFKDKGDANGANCTEFYSQDLCDRNGVPTAKYCPNGCDFEGYPSQDHPEDAGYTAPFACCHCGGGSHPNPLSTTAAPPTPAPVPPPTDAPATPAPSTAAPDDDRFVLE